jgi:hypothetical protein
MKDQLIAFWDKNKVFILGLSSAIALSLQQFTDAETMDIKVIAFAGLMAALSFLAKEWRGQGLSITGIVGNAAYVFITLQQNGGFTWQQFILQTIILIVTIASPDPKSRGYENTPVITEAKILGEQLTSISPVKK